MPAGVPVATVAISSARKCRPAGGPDPGGDPTLQQRMHDFQSACGTPQLPVRSCVRRSSDDARRGGVPATRPSLRPRDPDLYGDDDLVARLLADAQTLVSSG